MSEVQNSEQENVTEEAVEDVVEEVTQESNEESEHENIADENSEEVESTQEVEEASESEEATDAVVEEEWKPECKFNVLDNEYEFDDVFKSTVTKESYDKLKELHEKAYGLDHIKGKNEKLVEEIGKVRDNYNKMDETYNYVDTMIKNKDYNNLFKALNIGEEDLLKHAMNLAEKREMTPQQRQEYDNNTETKQRMYDAERHNKVFQRQFSEQNRQQTENMLTMTMQSQEIGAFAKDFDTRMGKPGAFRDELINRGAMIEEKSRRETGVTRTVPATEIASEMIKMYGGTSQTPLASQQTSQLTQAQAQAKPVIPNVSSGTQSAAKVLPNSLDDLRKIREKLET